MKSRVNMIVSYFRPVVFRAIEINCSKLASASLPEPYCSFYPDLDVEFSQLLEVIETTLKSSVQRGGK